MGCAADRARDFVFADGARGVVVVDSARSAAALRHLKKLRPRGTSKSHRPVDRSVLHHPTFSVLPYSWSATRLRVNLASEIEREPVNLTGQLYVRHMKKPLFV